MSRTIRIMLVEDNPEYREVIHLAIEDEPDMELTHPYGTAEIALRSLQDTATRQGPDLILLDLNLPGLSGLDALPSFIKAIPKAKVIILTQSDNETDVLRAISLGASGYLLKSSTANQITEAIKTVIQGGAPLDPSIAKFILKSFTSQPPKAASKKLLSAREIEILTLLAEGFVKKEIADRLSISSHTVITHVSHIYEKLHVSNAPSAINKAFHLGIFTTKRGQ
ncbi:response regulator [Planctomycetota bacterium]